MNYEVLNKQTSKILQKNRQASVFANNWEDSAKLFASLAVPKAALDHVNTNEDSFIAKSALFPELVKQVNLDELSISDLIFLSQAAKAIEEGDTKAAVFFRDTGGGKPVDKTEKREVKISDLTDEQIEYVRKHAKVIDDE